MLNPVGYEDEVRTIPTGINNVYADKCGKVVTLNIRINTALTPSTSGWQTLGTLPQELRPKTSINACGYDNGPGRISNQFFNPFNINSDGELRYYAWPDGLTDGFKPFGCITYLTE